MLAQQTHLVTPSNENILVLPAELSRKIGYAAAIVLNQIHYWTKRCGKDYHTISEYYPTCDRHRTEELDDHYNDNEQGFYNLKWVYNSIKEWAEQFPGFTYWQIRNALEKLRKLGFIHFAQFAKSTYKRYGWYAINYERVQEFLRISETLTQDDVRCTTSRVADGRTSSYITENNYQEITSTTTENADVDVSNFLNTEEEDKNAPIDQSSYCQTSQDLSVEPIDPHEDDYSAAPRLDEAESQIDKPKLDTDVKTKKVLIEGLGLAWNPKLQAILAEYSLEQVVKGIAAILYARKHRQVVMENKTGFLVDAIKNDYLENWGFWESLTESGRDWFLWLAEAIARRVVINYDIIDNLSRNFVTTPSGKLADLGKSVDYQRKYGWEGLAIAYQE